MGDDRPQVMIVCQDAKGAWVPLNPVTAASWVPEGDKHGDELKPSGPHRDFVVHLMWMPGPSTPARTKTRIGVTLLCSNHPGCCTNSGTLSLPDMTIEQERNPVWSVATGEIVRSGRPPLVLAADIPEYAGRQASNIRGTPAPRMSALSPFLNAREVIELRLTCYDWLCDGAILIEAGVEREWNWPRPQPELMVFPADLDRNELPDALEHRHR